MSDYPLGAKNDPNAPYNDDHDYRSDDEKQNEEDLWAERKRDEEHEEQIKLGIEIGGNIDEEPVRQQVGLWVWIRRLLGLGP